MLFGNTQTINNSKYEIFIICSCEGLFGNILLLFLCPQRFLWEGRKTGILQRLWIRNRRKTGAGEGVIHVLLAFHSLTRSIWASDLTQVEKPTRTDLEAMGLLSLQVMGDSLLGHQISGNLGLSSLSLKASLRWAAGGDALPVGGVDVSLSPLQGSGCLHHSWSCNTLWKGVVYMRISPPLVTTEEGFSLLLASLRCQAYWIIELFCLFEHAFKIGTS